MEQPPSPLLELPAEIFDEIMQLLAIETTANGDMAELDVTQAKAKCQELRGAHGTNKLVGYAVWQHFLNSHIFVFRHQKDERDYKPWEQEGPYPLYDQPENTYLCHEISPSTREVYNPHPTGMTIELLPDDMMGGVKHVKLELQPEPEEMCAFELVIGSGVWGLDTLTVVMHGVEEEHQAKMTKDFWETIEESVPIKKVKLVYE